VCVGRAGYTETGGWGGDWGRVYTLEIAVCYTHALQGVERKGTERELYYGKCVPSCKREHTREEQAAYAPTP